MWRILRDPLVYQATGSSGPLTSAWRPYPGLNKFVRIRYSEERKFVRTRSRRRGWELQSMSGLGSGHDTIVPGIFACQVTNTVRILSFFFLSFFCVSIVRIPRRPLASSPNPLSGFCAGQSMFSGPNVRIFQSKRSGIEAKNRPICPDSGSGISWNFPGSWFVSRSQIVERTTPNGRVTSPQLPTQPSFHLSSHDQTRYTVRPPCALTSLFLLRQLGVPQRLVLKLAWLPTSSEWPLRCASASISLLCFLAPLSPSHPNNPNFTQTHVGRVFLNF
jgi:hypothetical protein